MISIRYTWIRPVQPEKNCSIPNLDSFSHRELWLGQKALRPDYIPTSGLFLL
jgi:hypothetical protein